MTGKPRSPARLVACPECGAPAAFSSDNPWRPFCSERCRNLDLGAWAAEAYRIPLREGDPGTPVPGDGDEASGGPDTPKA